VDETRSDDNVVYRCTYPKYRRKVIDGPIEQRLKEIIREVCAEREAPIVELETMLDHVHLLVSVDPQYGIHRLIKGRSSQLLRQEFQTLRSPLPTLWTNSYFVATVAAQPRRSSNAMSRTRRTRERHSHSSPRLKPGASSELPR
jgi:putative transposase